MGGTKLERFLPKNQHTQRKWLNFENWVNGKVPKIKENYGILRTGVVGRCQKVPKFDFYSQFSKSRIFEIFHNFFH